VRTIGRGECIATIRRGGERVVEKFPILVNELEGGTLSGKRRGVYLMTYPGNGREIGGRGRGGG